MAKTSNAAAAVAVLALLVVAPLASGALFKPCGVDPSALGPCLPYCAVGSTVGSPTRDCCAVMGGADVQCLCNKKDTLIRMARNKNIDAARAMTIPYKCGITSSPNPC
ncbi:non-specific lipid-transfer protein 2-like [Phragmites australis]|uniref:non-specific lipid-transfer protein 2-like n=1 Tax=Phragmites australis TaxID=29695 RepID=UPI002D76DD1B|nr:non-specific lipid-transfer protein 2-like [Phragmites australis]